VEFEWHEDKRLANIARHGIDFEDAIAVWEGPVIEVPSFQAHHGEARVLATGLCAGRLITVVFTWRGSKRRIISARVARNDERQHYQQAAE
jgi:uncharacterized protein